jgi:PAS domain S-box-containing protein
MTQEHSAYPKRFIRLSYTSALVITALLGLFAFLLVQSASRAEQITLDALEDTTNERMYFQRIAFLIALLTNDANPREDAVHQEILERLAELEALHASGLDSGADSQWPPKLYLLYFEESTGLIPLFGQFVALAHRINDAAFRFSPQHPDFQHLLVLAPQLREQYNVVVDYYLQRNQAQVKDLQRINLILFVMLLSGLVLQAWFIFRPMERAIHQQQGTLHDEIAQRQRTEAALRHSETLYRTLVHNLPDMAVVLFDLEQRILLAEGRFLNSIRRASSQLKGKRLRELFRDEEYAPLESLLQRGLSGQRAVAELTFRDYLFDIQLIPLIDDTAIVVGGLIVAQDITERRQLQELQAEQRHLETILQKEVELSALKSRMMVRIGHEFRTPLSVILMLTETLEHYYERLTVEQRATKRRAIHAQIRLITQMLDDMSLVVQSSLVPERMGRGLVGLSARCREAVALTSKDAPAITVTTDIADYLLVSGDGAMLQRAIQELVKNAAQFSAPGDTVHVTLKPLETHIELVVHDNGIGILEEELEMVFEPFYRGSNIDEVRGLGLGLAIAYTIIQAHNGSIAITSEVKVGTTVTVTFPRVVQEAS